MAKLKKKKSSDSSHEIPQMKLQWQGALKILSNRIFKIRNTKGHGTGFHIGNFGTNGNLCAIATAYHVVRDAHDWGESIKLIHDNTGKEVLLKENDRAILTYKDRDLAVILFNLPKDLNVPSELISLIPSGKYINPGVDVGWCGFPGVRSDKLCFFHGYISCFLDNQNDYLIDGVAINGVSGGPVFYIDETLTPKVAGVITAYIANRATGETLPGLSMITSIQPCEETIKELKNLPEAKGAEVKQEKQESTKKI